MSFIHDIFEEAVEDGVAGITASALGAVKNRIDEGVRKKEEKNKDKIAHLAKKSKYSHCDILMTDKEKGNPKYEVRDSSSQLVYTATTKGTKTTVIGFDGKATALIVAGKLEKKGFFSGTSYHQELMLYIENVQKGIVECSYSDDDKTIKASFGEWKLWFKCNEKKYSINEAFSISLLPKTLTKNYSLEYNKEDDRLSVALIAMAIIEAQNRIEKIK